MAAVEQIDAYQPAESSRPVFLAGASERMRAAGGRFPGRPGRPRRNPRLADHGHVAGTLPAATRMNSGPARRPEVQKSRAPRVEARLLGLSQAAEYLGLSVWTLREMVAAGKLPRVRLPVRKLLFDREALDRLIASSTA